MLGAFLGDDLAEADEAVFGGNLRRLEQRGLLGVNRADIDDRATPPLYMCRRQAFVVRNAPSRWIASIFFHSPNGNSSIGFTI